MLPLHHIPPDKTFTTNTGGDGGIRTHGHLSVPTVFKTVPISQTPAHLHSNWCRTQDSNLRRISPPAYKAGPVGHLGNPALLPLLQHTVSGISAHTYSMYCNNGGSGRIRTDTWLIKSQLCLTVDTTLPQHIHLFFTASRLHRFSVSARLAFRC